MAIIKVTTTGSGLTGSVGDVYYKIVNGKQVVCSMPTTYRTPQDPVSKNNRNNIKYLSYISKIVTHVDFFYDMWFLDELRGTGPYHKFLGFNHPGKQTLDYTKIKLSPASDIAAEIDTLNIKKLATSSQLNITFKPLGESSSINTVRERFIALGGFIIQATYSKKTPLSVVPVQVSVKPIQLDEPLSFSTEIRSSLKPNYTLLLVLATLSSTEEQLRYSDTFVYVK